MTMKRCDYCTYHKWTEQGEEVCTKHLYCLDDLERSPDCGDCSVDLHATPLIMIAVFIVAFLVLVTYLFNFS